MSSLMDIYDEQHRVAEQIAIEARVLKVCQFHEEVYQSEFDGTPAYRLGNYKFTKGELTGTFDDRREMTDAIKAAIENAGDECGRCANIRDE